MSTPPSIDPITWSVPCLLLLRSTPSPGQRPVYSSFDHPHHQVSALSTLPSLPSPGQCAVYSFAPITRSVPCLLLRPVTRSVSYVPIFSPHHQVSVICTPPSPPSPGHCHMYSSFSPITRSVSYLLLHSHRLVSAICTPNSPPCTYPSPPSPGQVISTPPLPPSPGQGHMYSSFAPITRSVSHVLFPRPHHQVSVMSTKLV